MSKGETKVIEAVFVGANGSLGFKTGVTYRLHKITDLETGKIKIIEETIPSSCEYISEKLFKNNWLVKPTMTEGERLIEAVFRNDKDLEFIHGYKKGHRYQLYIKETEEGVSIRDAKGKVSDRVYSSEEFFKEDWEILHRVQRKLVEVLGEGNYPEIEKFVLLEDKMLVKADETEMITKSGIIIPESAEKERSRRGTVLAVGRGYEDKVMTVKPFDRVVYGQYAGSDIELDGVKLLLMREVDLFGIL